MKKRPYYWIYILEVGTGKYYTGYTTDIYRRYAEHLKGSPSSKFTRTFKVKRLLRCWKIFDTLSTVLKIEILVKRQTRKTKEKLVNKPKELKVMIKGKWERNIKLTCWDGDRIARKVVE